ncbi:LamG domain-containing protein, partial [Candidatus Woesearchaeota archaeon]|nr:LamG domain-containing protein [Candidatus Woesearchaeota archaeon]
MIDVKAKAKPLYFILVALVLISLTTIIAGTTNTDNSTETIPETWSFFTLEDEFILGEPVDFYILPSNADYYITITNPDTTVMNISGLRTYPKQIGVYESCASITYESETREFSTVFAVLENSSGEVLGGKVYNQGQAIKEENKQLGQKLQDEPDYETHFLSIEKTADYLFVTFYHDYNGILPVRVEGDVNYTLSKESIDYLENATLVVGLVEEIIPKFKLHVGPESEVFEFGKSIPTVDIENGNYTLEDRDDSKLNVEITSDNEKIDLEGIEDQSLIIANIEKVDDAEITTSVAAVQPIDIEQATITLEKTGDVNAILRCDDDKLDYDTMQCSEWVKTDIPFTDNGDTITFTVDHFSGYAGGYITIINVQSYPMVGGNWTVRFTTDGTANLTITAIDGTGFGADLEFLELKCGDIILNADYDGTRIFYEDYQCDEEGSETSLVLTPGEHHLMFEFGDSVGYANNSATNIYNFVKPTVVNVSGSVNITVFWSEPTENMTLFICRYNDCLECYQGPDGTPTQTDGCLCWNSEQRYTSSNCTYQTQENDPSQVSFWIKLYNASQYGPSSVPANYGSSPEPNTTGFQVNHRPNATNIVITPSSANKSSTLSCGYTFYDQDGDAELAGSVQYKWWVGGIDIGVTTSTLSNQYFNKTNVTICGVKVTDNHGFPDDRHENSSGVTIQNSPPTKPSITIDPSAPSVGQDVYCNVTTNSTDADSDAVNYTYRWINGSTLVRTFGPTAQIYDMLGSGNTSYGETWICNVTPFDGEVSGISKSANFTIGNTAPEARNVTINSTDNLNRTNGTLTGGWDFYDIDSDSESAYETRWYENNTEQAGFRNQTQISSADTTKGEKWRFSVRVYDGMVWSAWVNSTNLTIVNAIPEHSTPILNTTLPANSSAANLTCYPQSVSDKDNDDVKNIFNWYKDSVSIAVLNMPFEGGSNSTWTKDYSGHNNGTVVGANWSSSAGYDGKGAYEFDGADDHINLTLTNLTTFTYSARIKVESFGGGTGFIMDMDNWAVAFYVYNSSIWPNSLLFYVDNVPGDSEVTANNSIQLGRWHHVAGTFDGTQLKLYFDGELVDCNTTDSAESTTCTDFTTTIPGYTNFHLTLGNEKGGSDFFNGTIDDVMIFNRSLSAAQIKALYENRTDLIAPDETNKGETWHVQVTPNDGEADGATLTSNSITLINYVPTHSTPLLSSTRGLNSSGGNLTCNAVNLIDIDNDDIKQTINWYVNDASILVLNMPFDMNHTTNNITRDYTIFENNGTVINATWNSTGGYDGKGAYMFNGSNDYINCGNDSSLQFGSGNFTLSAWVKTESSSSQIILMKGDGAADIYYYLRMNNGNISVTAGDGSQYTVTSASTYNDGNWHFATGVRDGNNLRLYVDGVEDPNSPTDISSLTSTDYGEDLVIGRYGPSSMWYFNGTIDDVMIFNRSLSAEQIKALYENRTNLLVSQETRGSEAWKCDITPNDGELEAATLTSNTLTLKATPIINVSNISRIVATNYPTLTFSITGDNEINISSVLLYVYGVNSTYHTLVGSTYYDSYGWTFGSNITCTGNDTYYDCTLTLDNITSGHYNLTFSVKDIGDDTGYAYIYNYIVDTTPPVILKVFNGYYDGKGHISTHATI